MMFDAQRAQVNPKLVKYATIDPGVTTQFLHNFFLYYLINYKNIKVPFSSMIIMW